MGELTPFDYRKPDDALIPTIAETRELYKAIYRHLDKLPPTRERSIAITELESSCQWAIKNIVFNLKP